MRAYLWVFAVAAILAGCGTIDARSVQDIGAWGIGWQLKAPQNRIGPAIPPVVAFLRAENPAIGSLEPPPSVAATFRTVVLTLAGSAHGKVERRLVGVFTVSGQGCAFREYPVREDGKTVAAFLTLDSSAMTGEPSGWTLCERQTLPAGRDAAFRVLLLSALDRALSQP